MLNSFILHRVIDIYETEVLSVQSSISNQVNLAKVSLHDSILLKIVHTVSHSLHDVLVL